jgi:hypothetical protein
MPIYLVFCFSTLLIITHRFLFSRGPDAGPEHLLIRVSNWRHRRALPFDDNHIPGPVSRSTPKSCEARCGANSEAGLTATVRGRVRGRHRSRRLHHATRDTTSRAGPSLHRDRRRRVGDKFITHLPAPSGPPRTAARGRPQVVPGGGAGGLDVVRKFRAH